VISGRTTRAVFFPGMMGILLFAYFLHPIAGWSLMAGLAVITAAWHHRRAVRATEA
jgi:hypothetical protein